MTLYALNLAKVPLFVPETGCGHWTDRLYIEFKAYKYQYLNILLVNCCFDIIVSAAMITKYVIRLVFNHVMVCCIYQRFTLEVHEINKPPLGESGSIYIVSAAMIP